MLDKKCKLKLGIIKSPLCCNKNMIAREIVVWEYPFEQSPPRNFSHSRYRRRKRLFS